MMVPCVTTQLHAPQTTSAEMAYVLARSTHVLQNYIAQVTDC